MCKEFIGFVLVDRADAETITATVDDFGDIVVDWLWIV